MRFGTWREAPLVLGLAALLGLSLCCATTEAGGWPFHTLPGEVPAYDFNTGGEYFAPPVPYGHYAKDPLGQAAKAAGHVKGSLMGLLGKGHGLGHGLGLGHGGDCDECGRGGLGHGHGNGLGLGNGLGCGHGLGLGGGDCGFCSGRGLLGRLHGDKAGTACDPCGGRVKNFGPYHPAGVVASAQAVPSPQAAVMPSGQSLCGGPGACGLKGCGHGGLLNKLRCRLCGGNGCGGCDGLGIGDPCSSCHGSGCGNCGGCGLLSKLRNGCSFCGGNGCGNCLKGMGSGLKNKLHGLMGAPMGLFGPKVKWFVGPGGPVPLTPGYTPYIVTTRSPRDFFAFPPKNPDAF